MSGKMEVEEEGGISPEEKIKNLAWPKLSDNAKDFTESNRFKKKVTAKAFWEEVLKCELKKIDFPGRLEFERHPVSNKA